MTLNAVAQQGCDEIEWSKQYRSARCGHPMALALRDDDSIHMVCPEDVTRIRKTWPRFLVRANLTKIGC